MAVTPSVTDKLKGTFIFVKNYYRQNYKNNY